MKNNSLFDSLNKKHHSTTVRFFIRSLLINSLLILIPLLLIGLYSIFRTAKESTQEAEKRASRILNQTDDILETFYTHVDNAYLFFASNPRVNLQLKNAFVEKSLSLNSIKSVENISLNFQNLIYTDDYLQNIYIYYKNDYSRIFIPLSAKLISFPPNEEKEILVSYHHAGAEDVWMEFSDDPLLYTEYPAPSLVIYRKLYHRTTDVQNGLIIFSFNADRLKNKLQKLLEYEDQQIFLIDSDNRIVWPSTSEFSEETLLSLSEKIASDYQQSAAAVASQDYSSYSATYLHSPRSYGFSYLLLTPKDKIYETTINLTSMYIFITLAAIGMACMIAFFKTRHDYKYLRRIISTFSMPDTALKNIQPPSKRSSSPFEYILLNVIRLFIEHDYLKMQDSEKTAKLQLSKMQALQHQINPHFLHNTLNSIYWESVKLTGSENQCSHMISHLSAIMRYSLSDPQENVKIQNEIDYLKKYLEIMKVRYINKFDAKFQVDHDCSIYPVKKMLLQPLVENSIYHGFKEKKGRGVIRISVHRKRNRIYFSIYDTGSGISAHKLAAIRQDLNQVNPVSNENIGLMNTNSRLVLSYGPDSGLHINSRYKDFTVIWFSIPVPPKEDSQPFTDSI
ncbi:cache domain-containing sensor histidine kinase [Lacrimispora sp.]|uniref:cache domain-containing sensor histidine kinase n=1 Tax=Lacrimispora sp. TaxID=2719234 RepID=UPI002FD9602B